MAWRQQAAALGVAVVLGLGVRRQGGGETSWDQLDS